MHTLTEPKNQRVVPRAGAENYFLDIFTEFSALPHDSAVFYITDLRATVRACNLELGTAVPVGQSFLNVAKTHRPNHQSDPSRRRYQRARSYPGH